MADQLEIMELLSQAKALAQRYRALTSKPLGITGEVAEFEAARILGLTLSQARQTGYDAIEIRAGKTVRVQIKGRCVQSLRARGRVGRIDVAKEFDSVMLVLLDFNFDALAIYEAARADVLARLIFPGSKARNERGSLGISQFRSIADQRWVRPA